MAHTIVRQPGASAVTGLPRSSFFRRQKQGLMPLPVDIGGRARGYPLAELEAVNEARIRGASDDQIRELVKQLHAARIQLQAAG